MGSVHDTHQWCIQLERRGGVVELLTRANKKWFMVGINVKLSSFEVFAEYMHRSSWSMVLYDFWAYPVFGRKKLAVSSCHQLLKSDASTVMQVVLVGLGWLSRIAELALFIASNVD